MARGRFFAAADVTAYAPVVVLGETVASALFPDGENTVGQWILSGKLPLQVVGVLSPKDENNWGRDQDDLAILPIHTVQQRQTRQCHHPSVLVTLAHFPRLACL